MGVRGERLLPRGLTSRLARRCASPRQELQASWSAQLAVFTDCGSEALGPDGEVIRFPRARVASHGTGRLGRKLPPELEARSLAVPTRRHQDVRGGWQVG